MRKLLLLLALLTFLAPALPAAAEEGPYLAVHYGGVLLDDAENTGGGEGTFHFDFKTGTLFGGAIGYNIEDRFPAIGKGRIEAEAVRRSNDLDRADFEDGKVDAGGEIEVLAFMFNTFGEYRSDSPWVPYVGLGLGYAEVSLKDATVTGVPLADDEDQVFAYQAGVGLGLEVGDHVEFDLGYRYFATLDPEFEAADGSKFDSEYSSHNLLLGLRLTY